eukprot:TRINITY_DN2633_c0_g1_i2.p1 TRINITY_DN2633_c0_g1~~TRINITY_DN2633_c0_g1_i2.p1  ORF type:complete len:105 (+),score=13.34 TRINITY_DN2633_c0_g1_i2:343-657(+)
MEKKEIVGVIGLMRMSPTSFDVSKLGVSASGKGKGIGKKLLEAVIHLAKERGAHTIELDTNSRLVPAYTLYKKLGFSNIPIREDIRYARTDTRMQLVLVPKSNL